MLDIPILLETIMQLLGIELLTATQQVITIPPLVVVKAVMIMVHCLATLLVGLMWGWVMVL